MKNLESILQAERDNYFGTLLVSESVFSMDGDVAPLREMCELAKKYNTRVLIDEAHSLGVIGEKGFGLIEEEGLFDEVDIIMSNTSKALGSLGGFLAADKEVLDWLNWFSRSRIFSTSMPPSSAAAALEAFRILKEDDSHVKKLQENIKLFVNELVHIGFDVDKNHSSAIIPVIIGDEEKLGIMNRVFEENGIYVNPIVYPAVSRKSCRFRFTICSSHSRSDLDYVLTYLKKAAVEAKIDLKNKK